MLVPLHLCDVAWAAWFVSDVRFWKCSRKQVTQLESRQKLPAPLRSVVLKGLKDFGRAALWAVIQLVLLKLSVVLMVSDYRITVISGDNLIAGALPVQPEATPFAATKTTVQMHGEQTDRLNPRLWGVMSSRCRVLNVQPEPEKRRARPQLWVGCQVKAVWRRVVTGNTSCLSELHEIQETRQVNEQIPPRNLPRWWLTLEQLLLLVQLFQMFYVLIMETSRRLIKNALICSHFQNRNLQTTKLVTGYLFLSTHESWNTLLTHRLVSADQMFLKQLFSSCNIKRLKQ